MTALLLLFTLALGGPQAAATATVEGTVRRSGSGEPLENVVVTLTGSRLPYALSDREGRFRINNAPPGNYTLTAALEGYLNAPGNASLRRVVIGPGQTQIDGADLELVAGGVISGRVLDIDGEPLVRARVSVLASAYRDGRRVMEIQSGTATDDRGNFRAFWLAPGEYLVAAEYTRPVDPRSPVPANRPRTYFPGVIAQDAAVPVKLSQGAEAVTDFRMASGSTFKISGRVILREEGARLIVSTLQISPRDGSGPLMSAFNESPVVAQQRGEFLIRNVLPGSYYLFASARDASSSNLVAQASVDVVATDVNGVEIVIKPNVDLHGRIVIDAPDANQLRITDRIGLRAPLPFPPAAGATVDASGAFTFPKLPPTRYRLTYVPATWPDSYLLDMRQGQKSLMDDGFIVPNADEPLEIVLGANGGRIEGATRPNAIVTLVPNPKRRQHLLLYKRVTADANGRFLIRGVTPGEYKLFAWQSLPSGAEQNAEFIAKYEESGLNIDVSAGASIEVQANAVPAESIQ